jgi:site-specific DNA-methyltransferase (adenine-specific)
MVERFSLHLGDCREVMSAMDAESIDAIVSDPPYGLSFMGKGWDHGVPGVEFWTEALRVAKPGAHLVAFGGTRTYHRLACAIEDAGWEIRDCLMWVYGSGFPKSHNLKGERDGWGTALKPAWEPIILARKPPIGTVAANVARYGTGAINVDGCRVPIVGEAGVWGAKQGTSIGFHGGTEGSGHQTQQHPAGRWPANVAHDGSQMVLGLFPVTKAPKKRADDPLRPSLMDWDGPQDAEDGSAARFFYCAKASKADRDAGLGDLPEATPGQRTERKEGSAGVTAYAGGRGPARNIHPTVKPTDLMRWLVRMVTPPGGVVLDPFMGSGSTGRAAMLEGMRFVGVDITPEYLEIARRRIVDAAGGTDAP